ncbi:hypothetical protein ACQCU1_18895 [Sutcliffiella horikoshii]|uniref:hypothetical protein n=1 Tax=Sutcliffiella horikoshii TaxID=79883 RepID=UPI003CED6B3A
MNLLIISIMALICGGGNKYADLFNEHGLKQPHKYADILWGYLWGLAGAYLVYIDPNVAVIYIGTTLYWFLRIKLEYFNHALAGTLILLSGFYYQSEYIMHNTNELLFIFLAFSITGYIQKYLKLSSFNLWWLWRLRLRIYLIPLIYSIYTNNYLPVFVTVVAMLGNELVRYIYSEYENDSSLISKKSMTISTRSET